MSDPITDKDLEEWDATFFGGTKIEAIIERLIAEVRRLRAQTPTQTGGSNNADLRVTSLGRFETPGEVERRLLRAKIEEQAKEIERLKGQLVAWKVHN